MTWAGGLLARPGPTDEKVILNLRGFEKVGIADDIDRSPAGLTIAWIIDTVTRLVQARLRRVMDRLTLPVVAVAVTSEIRRRKQEEERDNQSPAAK